MRRGLTVLAALVLLLAIGVGVSAGQYVSDGSITVFEPVVAPGDTLHVEVECGDDAEPTALQVIGLRDDAEITSGTVDPTTGSGEVVIPGDTTAGHYRVRLTCTKADGSTTQLSADFQVVDAATAPTSGDPTFTG